MRSERSLQAGNRAGTVSGAAPSNSADWAQLLTSREDSLQRIGARYLHVQLPSRQQLTQAAPHQAPTRHDALVNALPMLRRLNAAAKLLDPATDELTAEACYRIVQLICSKLDLQLRGDLLNYSKHAQPVGGGLRECYRFTRDSRLRFASPAGQSLLRARAVPATNARVFFANASPRAIHQTVLVFGAPMAELSRSLIGGILAESFRRVHVVATEALDLTLAERVRPDIVISLGRGALDQTPPRDEPGNIARFEHCEPEPAATLCPGSLRETQLLGPETYELPTPITVQSGCVDDVADTHMLTRPVKLIEAIAVDLFFDGGRIHVANSAGEPLLTSGLAAGEEPPRKSRLLKARRFGGTSFLLGASSGASCYYHWMLELLPRLGLLQQHGIKLADIDRFLVNKISGPWQLETLAHLGIGPDRIVEMKRRPHAHCERLLHVDHTGGINLKMHRFVPLWLKHLMPLQRSMNAPTRLYIGRPPGVRRGVTNEAELEAVLDHHGVTRVVMEGLSVAEQAQLLSGAELVIAPHGGALTNMVFCRPGTQVVELLSRHVFPYYRGLAACCGHIYYAALQDPERDYSRLVSHDIAQACGSKAEQRSTSREGFAVDPVILNKLLLRVSQS